MEQRAGPKANTPVSLRSPEMSRTVYPHLRLNLRSGMSLRPSEMSHKVTHNFESLPVECHSVHQKYQVTHNLDRISAVESQHPTTRTTAQPCKYGVISLTGNIVCNFTDHVSWRQKVYRSPLFKFSVNQYPSVQFKVLQLISISLFKKCGGEF